MYTHRHKIKRYKSKCVYIYIYLYILAYIPQIHSCSYIKIEKIKQLWTQSRQGDTLPA